MDKKKEFPIKCAAALLLMLCAVTADAARQKLRIMTFNVPQRNIPAVGLNTWANRSLAITNFFNAEKPDIIGGQEYNSLMCAGFLSGMPEYAMLGIKRDQANNSIAEYCPIFYRADRLIAEKSGTYWLSTTPEVMSRSWNSTNYRIATWAIFRDCETGARFLFTNTHLEYLNTKPLDRQMRVLKRQMKNILDEEGDMPAFLTGDFNNTGTEDTSPVIAARSYLIAMRDAYDITSAHHGPTNTAFWGENADEPVKIDYIFVTRTVKVSDTYIHNSWYDNGQQISDHNAFYADVEWDTSVSDDAYCQLESSRACLDSLTAFGNAAGNLIADASQLSDDGTEEGSSLEYLTDNNLRTVYYSEYTDTVLRIGTHYLQADLKSNVRAFSLSQSAGSSSEQRGLAPAFIRIWASDDGNSWEYVADISDIRMRRNYTSKPIIMPRPMRYVRLQVLRTGSMDMTKGEPHFAIAEMQLRDCPLDSAASKRFANPAIRAACDSLEAKMGAVRQAPTRASINVLATALADVRAIAVGVNAPKAQPANGRRPQSVYTTDVALVRQGVDSSVSGLAKGIYIIGGKKVIIK